MQLNKVSIFLILLSISGCTLKAYDVNSDRDSLEAPPTPKEAPLPIEPTKDERIEPPPEIAPFELPTFTGKRMDWGKSGSTINPLPIINSDAIFVTVVKCYPLESGFGLEISAKAGLNFRDTIDMESIVNNESSRYYAGIVASIPLYSDNEIDRERKLEYQRRKDIAAMVEDLVAAVANRRRAHRRLGLFQALEQRSQDRVRRGIAPTSEQVDYLEKVVTAQGELDAASAAIDGARLALIGQCRSDQRNTVNKYLLKEIER